METEVLHVRMLGEFVLQKGDREIGDGDNRSRKQWMLLAYLLYHRGRPVPQEEIIRLLWSSETGSANPSNALKTLFHRVRTSLDQLDAGSGHAMLLCREGSYLWNSAVPVTLDLDEFEALCHAAASAVEEDERLRLSLAALDLYRGDFLQKRSSEAWVVPIAARYHSRYLQLLPDTIALLNQRGRMAETAVLCRRALALDPYSELLYQHLMRSLLAQGRRQEAVAAFEHMCRLLSDRFGILPSDESRALYREAVRTEPVPSLSLAALQEQLQEPDGPGGALICDYDFFKLLYHAEARAVARSGDAVHIALISASGSEGQPLPQRSLDRCMDNLEALIRAGLRRGDVAARCSISQFLLLLPQATYESSCMVCGRILKAFSSQYPHSPAVLRYAVQPLEPNAPFPGKRPDSSGC